MVTRILAVLLLLLARVLPAGQVEDPRGALAGVVLDARTRESLPGATVELVGFRQGAKADDEGRFRIDGVPAGVHALKVSMLGYGPRVLTDLVVRPGRVEPLEIGLNPSALAMSEVTVRPDYFAARAAAGSVTQEFHREEIRRAPGSAEDVNRLVQSLPSVGMGGDDQRNDIIVRGGNPMENLFLVDGHPIHNINHFGSQGSSGGPMGMVHVDFIEDVRFSPGGFDARYGDRLSSVMDIRFREGSRTKPGGEAFLSMAGMGLEAEGPLTGGKGSWLMGARRSYLELLKSQIGYSTAPVMADLSGKVALDLGAWRLGGLLLSGVNTIKWNTREDKDQNYNVDQTQSNLAGGFSLDRHDAGGRSQVWRLTVNRENFDHDFSLWDGHTNHIRNKAWEETWSLGHERGRPGLALDWRLGLGLDRAISRHRVRLSDMRSSFGDPLPDDTLDLFHEQNRAWAWLQNEWRPAPGRTLRLGLRVDHDDDTGRTDMQPRTSLRQELGERWAINLALGDYAQGLPVSWRVQSADSPGLRSMRSRHLQIGAEFRPRPELLLSLDAYQRRYRDLPVSEFTPAIPLADAGSYYGYSYLGRLSSEGRGLCQGVELLAQKKLSRRSYGSFSYSWSISRYRTRLGKWVAGPFDRRHMATVIAGWVPSHRWEMSLKWRIYGGLPSTPVDAAASAAAGDTRYRLEDYATERTPLYHRLDLRVDYRIQGRRLNLVQFWDIENAYDRKNVAYEYWHHTDNQLKTWHGWRIMPVYGLTVEF